MMNSHNLETDNPGGAALDPARTLAQPSGVSTAGSGLTTALGPETVEAAQGSLTDGVRVRDFGDYEIHARAGPRRHGRRLPRPGRSASTGPSP